MNTQTGLKEVLSTANFSLKARNAIIEFICESITELANLPAKDLDNGVNNLHKALSNIDLIRDRVRLNATKCILLHSIRQHFLDRINCAAPLLQADLATLTNDDINGMREYYLESRESQLLTSGLEETKVPKLTPLKWPDFKSAIHECLGRAIGKRSIPLLYIIRDNEVGDYTDPYDNRREKLVACMSLKGSAFHTDNGDVFSLLLQHTENTEGYTIVSNNEKKRNGRKAWKELSLHFEGSTFKERVAQEAGTILKTAAYSGPKRNFNFGDYYSLHAGAHAKLTRANKPMTVEQQIDTFIQGMQCATVQSIVVNLAGDTTVRKSFDTYYNAVASRLELSMSLTHKGISSDSRNVNRVEGEKHRSKSHRDSKKTNKRSKHNDVASRDNSSFVPELKIYDKSVWRNLSKANQDAVRALYASSGRNGRPGNNGQNNNRHQEAGRYQRNPQQEHRPQYPNHNPNNNPRVASQFEIQNYDNVSHSPYRGINMALPPYPGTVMIPPPPSYPPNPSGASIGAISANTGEIGQAFGNFRPGP